MLKCWVCKHVISLFEELIINELFSSSRDKSKIKLQSMYSVPQGFFSGFFSSSDTLFAGACETGRWNRIVISQ